MIDSGDSRLYWGLRVLEQKAEDKLLELQRWARVSFSLNVQKDGNAEVLSLVHAPNYSRSGIVVPEFYLGGLTFVSSVENEISRGRLSCSRSDLRAVGKRLCDLLPQFEAPPLRQSDREEWERESFSGNGLLPAPVAISGVDYFHNIVDKHGISVAPLEVFTYRTNDDLSVRFLKRLTL
jgi:hypothetical protein